MQPIHFTRPDERVMHLQPWTDRDLDQLAMVSTEDVDRAEVYWRRYLPRRLRDILSARAVNTDAVHMV